MGPEAMSVDEMMKIANQSSLTAPWPSGIGSADSHGPIKPGDSRSHEMHRLRIQYSMVYPNSFGFV